MSTVETNLVQPSTGTTLTLGAASDTIDIPSGATLDVTGATVSGLSAGKVLQVITATDTTASSVTSGSFTNTALTASITCAATTSRVLVWAQAPLTAKRNDNWVYNPYLRFKETVTTDVYPTGAHGFGKTPIYFASYDANTRTGMIHPCLWLHSPSSTSALTYTLQMSNGGVTTAEYCENSGDSAVIVLMEIGA